MEPYVLLTFLDTNGIQNSAKISVKTYERLMNSARGRHVRNPLRSVFVKPEPPSHRSWLDDPGIQDAFSNLYDTMYRMGGVSEETKRMFEETKAKFEENERRKKRQPPPSFKWGTSSNTSKPTPSLDHQLLILAGVEDISDDTLTKDERIKYLRRAKRKCHPDTGGSHDDWVNLEKLARRMGLRF